MKRETDVYISGGKLGMPNGYHAFPIDVVGVAIDYKPDNEIQFVVFDDVGQFIKTKDLEVINYD